MNKPFTMNLQLFGDNITTDAETNVVTKTQMSKVREVDFVLQFTHNSLKKLIEALGVTRKVPMTEGTTMYYYTTTGTLQSGAVAEGEVIPLSQYQRNKVPIGEITLSKWRKAVTAEAILKSGRDEAIRMTDNKMLSDVQKKIRTDFFTFLTGLDGTVVAKSTLQAVLAFSWAKLQTLFEDDAIEAVHFMNPLTIADDLSTRTITTQTAFGMTYIADYLGMGTVILASRIPVNQVFSTAKNNIIMYFLNMAGDIAREFALTTDETGYIGIHTSQTDNRAQIETLIMSGIQFLVEYASGVVKAFIDDNVLADLTVAAETDAFGVLYDGKKASDLQTDVTVSDGRISGTLKYIEGGLAQSGPLAGSGWFLALKWSNLDSATRSLKVGLVPSASGMPLQEAYDDSDRNGVFKITDPNAQVFEIVQGDPAGHKNIQFYKLDGLTLEPAEA